MTDASKKDRFLVRGIMGFCVLIIALMWYSVWQQLEADRTETIATAVESNANLAAALEQYAIGTIRNADAVIQLVKKEYALNPSPDLNELLNNYAFAKELFTMVSIVNEEGHIIASNLKLSGDTAVRVIDRDYFSQQRNSPIDTLLISHPVISRFFGRAAVSISRRLTKPDGSFGGIVLVQVEPRTFTRFYAHASLRPNDLFSLVGMDGITFARRKGARESYGEDIHKSPLYQHVAQQPIGHYFAKDAIFGIPTYFSFRKLPDYPMIATVGSAKDSVLAEFYKRQRFAYIGIGIISILLLLFGALVSGSLILRRKNTRLIKESEVKYRSFFENSIDAILITKLDGNVQDANPAALSLFGMTIEEIRQCGKAELLDFSNKHIEQLLQERQLTGKARGEISFLRKDRSRFLTDTSSVIYETANGELFSIMIIRDITEKRKMEAQLQQEQARYQRQVTEQVINAQEREREVIGRELHDNVNQVLTTVKLYLEMASSDGERRDSLLAKSIQYVMECINEIRNLSRDLSAPTLGTKSIVDSINALLEVVRSSSGLRIAFKHQFHQPHLSMEMNLALYRIVQEQLNNIIKHAQATKVLITLKEEADMLTLLIQDNGKGFDTRQVRKGIGINNIISRAKIFNGEVHIESEEGNGCLLAVKLPKLWKQELDSPVQVSYN